MPVSISVAIPSAASTGSAHRRALYVSPGTKSATVTYAGATQTTNCASSCQLTLNVTPGAVTFGIALYDQANGTGNVLSTAQTTATIVAGTNNTLNVTFGGVVASVAVSVGTASLVAGTPASVPVNVVAKDAAGYTIVGSESYVSPIALSTSGATGFTLSTASVTSPAAAVTLAYNGQGSAQQAHVTASVAGATGGSATVTVASAAAPPAATSGVPTHVATYYFYGINDVNASIPAAWMAAHADYVEDDGGAVQHATAFKAAGGKYAVSYTDPAYVPYCFAPFSGPQATCRGQVGNLISDETAWFHGSDGTRVRRYVDSHFGYQEALNPASVTAQNAYRQTTQGILANGPIDYFFADDSGGVYTGSDGTQMTGWFYGFNAPAVETTTDAAFIPAEKAMLAASAKPVILNGSTPYTMQPSYNGTWLDAPNVAAQNFEGCYSDGSGVAGASNNRWVYQSNAILATFAHHVPAVCMMYATPTPANRVYEMASWWMTYDPQYSVAAPYTSFPLSDGYTVVPEFDIVPRQPLQTASSDISSLRSANGAYVREFASCYQWAVPIGGCAAVVNPTNATVTLPALRQQYAHALVLDDASEYTGGKANWTGTIPATLAPNAAVVLR
ncbi:MAG TPA: hypothetical protein VHT53_07510 [Candidatus Elarobacter sp.]|nr:hypothetical protein [Candidatus Elarobacter sp.]